MKIKCDCPDADKIQVNEFGFECRLCGKRWRLATDGTPDGFVWEEVEQ